MSRAGEAAPAVSPTHRGCSAAPSRSAGRAAIPREIVYPARKVKARRDVTLGRFPPGTWCACGAFIGEDRYPRDHRSRAAADVAKCGNRDRACDTWADKPIPSRSDQFGLIHRLWGGFEDQASDIEIHAREAIALKRQMEQILAEHTGQPLEAVSKDMERDYFMTAEEAKDYGMIDTVIANRSGLQ
jgi:hypothetical protein